MDSKSIRLDKGISRTPTITSVGELADCVNLVVNKGEIVNAPTPSVTGVSIPDGYKLVYIHHTTGTTNYILDHDGTLVMMSEDGVIGDTREWTQAERTALYNELVSAAYTAMRTTQERITALNQALDRATGVTESETDAFKDAMEFTVVPNFAALLNQYDTRVYQVSGGTDYKSQYEAIEGTALSEYIAMWQFIEGNIDTIVDRTRDTYVAEYASPYNGYIMVYVGDTDEERQESQEAFEALNAITDVSSNSWYTTNLESLHDYCDRATIDTSAINAEIAILEGELATRADTYNAALAEYNRQIAVPKTVDSEVCEGYKSLTAIGNILIINRTDGILYARWREGKYFVYGSLPDLHIDFRLDSEYAEDKYTQLFTTTKNTNASQDEYFVIANARKSAHDGVGFISGESHYYVDIPLPSDVTAGQWCKVVATQIGANYYKWRIWVAYLDASDNPLYTQRYGSQNIPSGWQWEYYATGTIHKVRISYDFYPSSIDFDRYPLSVSVYGTQTMPRITVDNTSDNFTAIMGAVTKFIKRKSTDRNQFMLPFFVRYAIKMYDGSYVSPSAPKLMLPNCGHVPLAVVDSFSEGEDATQRQDLTLCALTSSLEYKMTVADNLAEDWTDLIDSVVIAVSAPIYTFNQGAEYDEDKQIFSIDSKTISEIADETYGIGKYLGDTSRRVAVIDAHESTFSTAASSRYVLSLPEYTNEQIRANVEGASAFYIIKEIKLTDMSTMTDYEDITLNKGVLDGLVGRARIDDASNTLQRYIPGCEYVYNSRLLIGDIRQRMFAGYLPDDGGGVYRSGRLPIARSGEVNDAIKQNEDISNVGHRTSYAAVVEIAMDNQIFKVYKPFPTLAERPETSAPELFWFYYPSSAAKRVTIYRRREGDYEVVSGNSIAATEVDDLYKVNIDLTEHPTLDGAYWFNDFKALVFPDECNLSNLTDDEAILLGDSDAPTSEFAYNNKIVMSNVANPMVFDMTSAELVGNGTIRALTSNTEALGDNQFGQHPILCFASDGVFAVPVTTEGKMSAVKPYGRDVITEGTRPLQTDNAVIFHSDGYLKMIDGRGVRNISQRLEGKRDALSALMSEVSETYLNGDWTDMLSMESGSITDYMDAARLMYDSANNLIHVYPSVESPSHYALSLSTGEWSRVTGHYPLSIVNGYPYSIMQVGTDMMRYRKSFDEQTRHKGLLLTREISMDTPLAVKMLHWLRVQRKITADNGEARIAVFVSNDRVRWVRLTSLRKHSYKWYRFAVFSDMADVDGLESINVGYEIRRTDKVR